MKLHWMIIAVAVAAILPRPALGGDADPDSTAERAPRLSAPALDDLWTRDYPLRDSIDPNSPGHLNLSLSISSMPWYQPPTRFDATMQGAGRAATMGLFLGAVGNTLGWFDENTTWWMTGTMAAMGAIYAGTKYESEPTLRIKWSSGDDDKR